MKNQKQPWEPLAYYLSLSDDIIEETKIFLFDLMEETARAGHLPPDCKEERIYLISQLHRLFTSLEASANIRP